MTARSRTSATKSAGEGNGPSALRCAGTADDDGTAESVSNGAWLTPAPGQHGPYERVARAADVVHSAVAASSRSRVRVGGQRALDTGEKAVGLPPYEGACEPSLLPNSL